MMEKIILELDLGFKKKIQISLIKIQINSNKFKSI